MISSIFRKFPHFKGKKRIARVLFSKEIEGKSNILVDGKFSCKYLLPNIRENVGFDIFVNGVYELETILLICRFLPQNGVFLDLGSNIGAILIPVLKRRPDIFSIAIEAAPWIYGYLQSNVELNKLDNIKLINNALFKEDGLELDFFSPGEKYGKGSLSPVFTNESVKVITKKLDTIVKEFDLKKVDLIKIDVEGFEYFVFKGGEKLLSAPDAPIIIFEFVDWAEKRADGISAGAAQRLLVEFGFELFEVNHGRIIPLKEIKKEGSGNLLAMKPNSK
jgi:FkbM family methyltransferase